MTTPAEALASARYGLLLLLRSDARDGTGALIQWSPGQQRMLREIVGEIDEALAATPDTDALYGEMEKSNG